MADVQRASNAPQPERPRKRRRRIMACMQCRSRKLRCDREYPTCGRCSKSKTPTKCTYEDGFLWQQPTTVSAPAFAPDRDTATSMSRVEQTPVRTPPDSGLGTASTRADAPVSLAATAPGPISDEGPRSREQHRNRERGFLETVLGAPKAAANQEPYMNTGFFRRPKRANPELGVSYASQVDREDAEDGDSDGALSPSQQLDLTPRIMMRGRETKTRFSGSGIYANLVAQFPDLRSFAEEIRLSNPVLSRVRPDLERVMRGIWKWKPLKQPIPEPTTSSLISLLPSRGVVDELIGLYLTYIESTHRIHHVPSFLREVDEFFASMDNPRNVSTAFVVQLLLVLACAWNLVDIGSLQEKNSSPLECLRQ